MSNILFTIFTPSYNRCDTLSRLYESLLSQTFLSFEWVIVDDGSTDNTSSLVEKWILEKKININYFVQENGGKHRAINKGLDLAKGELFYIVDSDDYLPNDSLEIVNTSYNSIKHDNTIIGVVGFCSSKEGDILGGKIFPFEFIDTNLIERRNKYNITADMAKVIKTNIFKEFYFPEILGEKFVAESIVWNRMAVKYNFRYINKSIYFAEYLEGGLSNNSIKNRRKNPKYATLLYSELTKNIKANLKLKIKSYINFWRFYPCRCESLFNAKNELPNIFMSLITLPFGFIYYLKDSVNSQINVKNIK